MDPAVIKDDAQLGRALGHLDWLRGSPKSDDRDRQIEVWELLVEHYRKDGAFPAGLSLNRARGGKEPDTRWLKWPFLAPSTCCFLLGTALLIYLRMMYHVTYFPAFFEGEESKVLDLAQGTVVFHDYFGSWWMCLTGGFIEYNKGFSWLFVPLYMVFGYDVRLIMFVMPAITGTLVAIFLTFYRKTHPRSSLFSFFLVAVFSLLCVCMRRYKWHPVAYMAAISVYLYFLPHFYKGAFFLGNKARRIVAVLIY
ncbi:MAG TPA: hypothetical protein VFE25_08435, partial [Opitutaceae bacterium]|nr:hypothetical protein [Opitutaceae bacterium]